MKSVFLSKILAKFASLPTPTDPLTPTPPLKQIESTGTSMRALLGLADQNPDEILKKQGINAYEEMESKDPHVYSVYQTRKLAVSRIPWEIRPANTSPEAIEIANFVLDTIDGCEGIV